MTFRRAVTAVIFLLLIISVLPIYTRADTTDVQSQIDTIDQQKAQLDAQIAQYQQQLNALGAQHQTLQTSISSLATQQSQLKAKISSTQKSIDAANLQLNQLGDEIGQTQNSIDTDQTAVAASIRDIQITDDTSVIEQVFSSGSLADAWMVMDEDQQLARTLESHTQDLASAKQSLTNTKQAVGTKQQQLTSLGTDLSTQSKQLTATKQQQQTLLTQTNNSEAAYQKLLAEAQAELSSLSTFTTNAGGTGLLSNQTVCDSWGCYYNQRDTSWGGLALDGTQYTLAADGCLITSMAMVMTHYGYPNVTPVTINSISQNFDAYTHANLLLTITAGGVSATRVREPVSTSAIDSVLASGNPVVVGLHAYGGTHFVVLVSGSGGAYTMRDPYIANGKDISFNAHYSVGSIYEVNKVVISS